MSELPGWDLNWTFNVDSVIEMISVVNMGGGGSTQKKRTVYWLYGNFIFSKGISPSDLMNNHNRNNQIISRPMTFAPISNGEIIP